MVQEGLFENWGKLGQIIARGSERHGTETGSGIVGKKTFCSRSKGSSNQELEKEEETEWQICNFNAKSRTIAPRAR